MDEMKPGWYLNIETREQTYWDGSQWSQISAPISVPMQTQPEGIKSETSNLAIIALIFSFAIPFVGWILGFRARREIAQSQGKQPGAPLATAAIWVGGIATVSLFALLGFGTIFSHSLDHHERDRGFGYHRSFDGHGYGFYNSGGSIIVPGMNAQPAPATP